MAGIADLLYLGQADPRQQLARLLSGQQPQGAPPPGPGPAPPVAGPAPGPTDPNAPASQAQPVNAGGDGSQPPANPVAPGAQPPPGSPPQPTVLQSSPDMSQSYQALANPPNLMSLYLQLDARNRASDQINHGLALIAANHSSPGMARAIMESVGTGANAGQQVGDLMQLYNAQQSMAAQQQLMAQAPAIAQKLGMDEATVRAEILAGRGPELIKNLEPTTEARDIQMKHDMFIKSATSQGQDPKAAEADWQRNYLPFIITGGQGGGDATTRSWQSDRIMWDRDHPGEPYPWGDNTPTAYGNWKTQQNELVKDQEDARNRLHGGYSQNITDLRNNLGAIIGLKPGGDPDNPNDYDQAKQDLLKSALSKPGAQAYLSGDPKDLTTQALGAALLPEEKAVLDQVREVSDKGQLFGTLNARAPKRGVSDVNAIGAGLGGMQNVRKGFDRYLEGVKTTIGSADKALGNGYGAAGEVENAPDYTKPLIDDAYLPGGSMYPFGKKPTPMSASDIAKDVQYVQQNPSARDKVIRGERASNHDTKELERQLS